MLLRLENCVLHCGLCSHVFAVMAGMESGDKESGLGSSSKKKKKKKSKK